MNLSIYSLSNNLVPANANTTNGGNEMFSKDKLWYL